MFTIAAIILIIPFLGTVAGSAFVFFMRKQMNVTLQKTLLGFAAGVMVAASVWSLLIPAIEMSADRGIWASLPAIIGFIIGVAFLLLIDEITPHLHFGAKRPEGRRSRLSRTSMLSLAVTIHNLPEGMAVGVVLAAAFNGTADIPMAVAVATAIGIAVQNIPEGAIISMPLRAEGNSKMKSFVIGSLSGIVEPVGGLLVVALASWLVPILPYLLAFAAGAMLYVVVEELIPETANGEHTNMSTIGFAVGFALMLFLDSALG